MLRIYHNPRCSKSRQALEALQAKGLNPDVVEYLKHTPTVEELDDLVARMGVAPSSLIRSREFKSLNLTMTADRGDLLRLIAENPSVLERPIVVCDNRACVARPVERLEWVLGSS